MIYDNDFDKAFDEAVDEIERKAKQVRLIDANKLKKHYAWWGNSGNPDLEQQKKDFDVIVDLQPTVEAEPIKHGRWKGMNKNKYNDDEATCSICGVTFASGYSNPYWWDYCPNCGADMRGGENG